MEISLEEYYGSNKPWLSYLHKCRNLGRFSSTDFVDHRPCRKRPLKWETLKPFTIRPNRRAISLLASCAYPLSPCPCVPMLSICVCVSMFGANATGSFVEIRIHFKDEIEDKRLPTFDLLCVWCKWNGHSFLRLLLNPQRPSLHFNYV